MNREEMINFAHFKSKKRMPMSDAERAAQFAPFSALVGFEKLIKEISRVKMENNEVDEQLKAEIDNNLNWIKNNSHKKHFLEIIFFKQEYADGKGFYSHAAGVFNTIKEEKFILLETGNEIPINEIKKLEVTVLDDCKNILSE